MNLQKKLKLGLLALALVLVVSAVPANAQQLYRATFTLPFEAQWGSTVIEPGEYTITVEEALGQKLIRVNGSGERQLAIFAGLSSSEPYGDNGKLVFVNVDGLYTLKAFSAAAIGQAFIFPVHKSKGERAQHVTTIGLGTN
ncbi:MAG TPA: hypothetical protein VGP62_20370 [Bryobacteraceae bacterium]|jgi:hypothetical protein|nr:hypothetical protein [Bryobacteraceae bacterium]